MFVKWKMCQYKKKVSLFRVFETHLFKLLYVYSLFCFDC